MASTHSATFSLLESPHGTVGRLFASIFSSARSVAGSTPTICASYFAPVAERHRDGRQLPQRDAARFSGDDVVVGQDEAVAADDNARAKAPFDAAPRPEHVVGVAEEELEERVVGKRGVLAPDHLQRRDVGDGGDRALGDAREVGKRQPLRSAPAPRPAASARSGSAPRRRSPAACGR